MIPSRSFPRTAPPVGWPLFYRRLAPPDADAAVLGAGTVEPGHVKLRPRVVLFDVLDHLIHQRQAELFLCRDHLGQGSNVPDRGHEGAAARPGGIRDRIRQAVVQDPVPSVAQPAFWVSCKLHLLVPQQEVGVVTGVFFQIALVAQGLHVFGRIGTAAGYRDYVIDVEERLRGFSAACDAYAPGLCQYVVPAAPQTGSFGPLVPCPYPTVPVRELLQPQIAQLD